MITNIVHANIKYFDQTMQADLRLAGYIEHLLGFVMYWLCFSSTNLDTLFPVTSIITQYFMFRNDVMFIHV